MDAPVEEPTTATDSAPVPEDTPAPEDTPVPEQEEVADDGACMSVTISRYDSVNYDDQTWCVGFTITCLANGRTTYMDTIVKREYDHNDIQIVETAWMALKERADAWCKTIDSKAAVIGITFRVA